MRSFLATLFASAVLAVNLKDTTTGGPATTDAPVVGTDDIADLALPICTGDEAVDAAGCIADTMIEDTAALPICTGDEAIDAAGCLPDIDGEIDDALAAAAAAATADTAGTDTAGTDTAADTAAATAAADTASTALAQRKKFKKVLIRAA